MRVRGVDRGVDIIIVRVVVAALVLVVGRGGGVCDVVDVDMGPKVAILQLKVSYCRSQTTTPIPKSIGFFF